MKIYRSETFANGSSKTSRDYVQKWGKFSNHTDYGANRPQHVWSNVATANETGSGCTWIMNMLLAGCRKFRLFLGAIFSMKLKNLALITCFLFLICHVGSWKALNKGKTVSAQCLLHPVWLFMRDIIFGLLRICRLQSRACGCMLGINPHLNPRGLLEIAQLLNEPFCLVVNIRFPEHEEMIEHLNKDF